MVDSILGLFTGKTIPPEVIIFLISMLPILELRGGLIAAALLGVKWYIAFPICFLGNILPIPFILLFFKKILALLKRTKLFGRLADKIEKKVMKKSKKLDTAKSLSLLLFVGIPLPGTGGWTGAMVAEILDMRIKKSFPVIAAGVFLAGVIMITLTYFFPGLFGF